MLSYKDYQLSKEEGGGYMKLYSMEPPPNRSYYIPKSFSDSTLVFESRFECGNL